MYNQNEYTHIHVCNDRLRIYVNVFRIVSNDRCKHAYAWQATTHIHSISWFWRQWLRQHLSSFIHRFVVTWCVIGREAVGEGCFVNDTIMDCLLVWTNISDTTDEIKRLIHCQALWFHLQTQPTTYECSLFPFSVARYMQRHEHAHLTCALFYEEIVCLHIFIYKLYVYVFLHCPLMCKISITHKQTVIPSCRRIHEAPYRSLRHQSCIFVAIERHVFKWRT